MNDSRDTGQQKSIFLKYIGKTGMNTNWNVSIIFHDGNSFLQCHRAFKDYSQGKKNGGKNRK